MFVKRDLVKQRQFESYIRTEGMHQVYRNITVMTSAVFQLEWQVVVVINVEHMALTTFKTNRIRFMLDTYWSIYFI